MQRVIAISYLLLWVVFIVFTLIALPYWNAAVPYWNTAILIPIFFLVGLSAWLYGSTIGYSFALIGVIYNYILSSVIFVDFFTYYENRLSGTLLGIAVVFLIGNIRRSYDNLKMVNRKLDRRIAERNAELNNLTIKLINAAESTRIHHAQTLHDGIGQQLTGIQLYCTSLAEQLVEEGNPIASNAFSMGTSARKAHNIIRKTARMLFPVRMQETGLIPAINELVSCLNEMQQLSIDAEMHGTFDDIPDHLALALYRISHESTMCAVTDLDASAIHLEVCEDTAEYHVVLRQNGKSWSMLKETMEHKLILYRLQSLDGMATLDSSNTINYRIPRVV